MWYSVALIFKQVGFFRSLNLYVRLDKSKISGLLLSYCVQFVQLFHSADVVRYQDYMHEVLVGRFIVTRLWLFRLAYFSFYIFRLRLIYGYLERVTVKEPINSWFLRRWHFFYGLVYLFINENRQLLYVFMFIIIISLNMFCISFVGFFYLCSNGEMFPYQATYVQPLMRKEIIPLLPDLQRYEQYLLPDPDIRHRSSILGLNSIYTKKYLLFSLDYTYSLEQYIPYIVDHRGKGPLDYRKSFQDPYVKDIRFKNFARAKHKEGGPFSWITHAKDVGFQPFRLNRSPSFKHKPYVLRWWKLFMFKEYVSSLSFVERSTIFLFTYNEYVHFFYTGKEDVDNFLGRLNWITFQKIAPHPVEFRNMLKMLYSINSLVGFMIIYTYFHEIKSFNLNQSRSFINEFRYVMGRQWSWPTRRKAIYNEGFFLYSERFASIFSKGWAYWYKNRPVPLTAYDELHSSGYWWYQYVEVYYKKVEFKALPYWFKRLFALVGVIGCIYYLKLILFVLLVIVYIISYIIVFITG